MMSAFPSPRFEKNRSVAGKILIDNLRDYPFPPIPGTKKSRSAVLSHSSGGLWSPEIRVHPVETGTYVIDLTHIPAFGIFANCCNLQ
jgi:hypothetical protein